MMCYRLFLINVKVKNGAFCTQTFTGKDTDAGLDEVYTHSED